MNHQPRRHVTCLSIADVGPAKHLQDVHVPLLVLHSGNDSVVPVTHAYRIYEESGTTKGYKELVVIPGIEHIGAYFLNEKRYIRKIVDFFDDAFSVDSAREQKVTIEEVEKEELMKEAEGDNSTQ